MDNWLMNKGKYQEFQEGQNRPPQNMLLWNKDYVKLKIIKTHRFKKSSLPPTNCLKNKA